MYTSPIDVIYGEMQMQVEGEIYKGVEKVGVNVDKEELLKALQYDRGQYEQGYKDGYNEAINVLVAVAMKRFTELDFKDNYASVISCKIILREIAEEMRCAE